MQSRWPASCLPRFMSLQNSLLVAINLQKQCQAAMICGKVGTAEILLQKNEKDSPSSKIATCYLEKAKFAVDRLLDVQYTIKNF